MKTLKIILATTLLMFLTACGGGSKETITLYANFSYGDETAKAGGDLIQTEEVEVEEITAEALADALSEWTGYNFAINEAEVDGKTIIIDWSLDADLFTSYNSLEYQEDFFLIDQDAQRWFFMDSLYQTITENMDIESVYYTMDGGKELEFDELYPVSVFPADIEYMGSPFYFAHSDGKGDMDDEEVETTETSDGRGDYFAEDFEITLYGCFVDGTLKTYTTTVTDLTCQSIADELSYWTGYDFTINWGETNVDSVYLDRSSSADLFISYNHLSYIEEFSFANQDEQRWFFMDSLAESLKVNLGAEHVYYSVDGNDLTFDDFHPSTIPQETEYMGSAFYIAHSGNIGD